MLGVVFAVLLRLFELVDDGVRLRSGLCRKLLRLVLRHVDLALSLGLCALELLLGLSLLLLCVEGSLTRSLQLVGELPAADLKALDDVLELPALGGGQYTRPVYHIVLHAQPLADGEGVALARYADQQLVRRAQGGDVELTAAVLNPRGLESVFL